MSLELRPLDASSVKEVEQVLALFQLVFGRPMTMEFYRWRFLANPFGPPLVMLLWDGDRLAGHYAASAMRGWYEGEIRSSQSMATMTHPDYRNREVFTTLATELFDRMSRSGVQMIWGYPNTKSHFGFIQRLGWKDVALLPTMTKSLEDVEAGAPTAFEVVDGLPAGVDELFLRSCGGRAFLSARDERYLRWRYLDNPAASYRILRGERDVLAVTKTYQMSPGVSSLEIVDYLSGGDPRALTDMIRNVQAWARMEGHAFVRTWATLSDPLYPLLERLAFVPKEPLAYFCLRALAKLPSELDSGALWSVTMGDSDNY